MDENEKLCENCYYYYQHYFKSRRGILKQYVGDGHCSNINIKKSESKKNFKNHLACEFWKPREAQIAERRESVCKIIYRMQKTLEDIALILKED